MAAGAGASLAFACDIRIAADDASFLMAFARVGLGPDSGASWTLQRLVGLGRATAMMMLAEPVAAPQALEMGLVSAVVPGADLASVVERIATKLAGGPTTAYAAIKETMAYAASHSLTESLSREAEAQARCGATADHANAVAAFLAKAAGLVHRPLAAPAVGEVVVDQPGRLHQRVHRRRPDEPHAVPFQLLGQRGGLLGDRRHVTEAPRRRLRAAGA